MLTQKIRQLGDKMNAVLHSLRIEEPDVRRLSLRAFVMELCKLDSKISAEFTRSSAHLITDHSVKKSLRFDLDLSRRECEKILRKLEDRFLITFNESDRRALLRTGFRISLLHRRCQYASWRKTDSRQHPYAVPH